MVLSHTHADITSIIDSTIANHVEGRIVCTTNRQYDPNLCYVRMVCNCGLTDTSDSYDRERIVRSARRDASQDTEPCQARVNFRWSKVSSKPNAPYAWMVGKVVSKHTGHYARTQELAILSPSQREQTGKAMHDACLSPAQVIVTRSMHIPDGRYSHRYFV